MILQALHDLYLRKQDELPPEGFEQKEIPFLIVLNEDGTFCDFQDTRSKSGNKLVARQFRVPKDNGRSGQNAWQSANLLWDHFGYVLAWPKSNSEADRVMAQKQHEVFVTRVNKLFAVYPNDPGIQAVQRFLDSGEKGKVVSHPTWEECKKILGCNLSFRLSNELSLVCENESVRGFVAETVTPEDAEDGSSTSGEAAGVCLITGAKGAIARLHHKTPILGAKSNSKIVSFQVGMGFDSYGKLKSYNAPTGKCANFAYTTALNHLLAKGSQQKIMVGNDTVIFWAEEKHDIEDTFFEIFRVHTNENPDQLNQAVRSLYAAPQSGTPPLDDDLTRFFVLGLTPNSARIAIRFWHAGTVGKTVRHIRQHFEDCAITHGPNQPDHLSLFRLLISTATQGESKHIPPNMAGDVMKAILCGTPYPKSLMAAVINRIRAEQSKKDQNGKPIQNVTYPRAALIKALLVREARYYKYNQKEIDMSLDSTNTNSGYLLGRLFAVLERVQADSSGGWGKINSTIRDRFYGSASSTPVAAFPHLMKLKNHHLSKLENNKKYYEGLIGEIINKLDPNDAFPAHLSLSDQGRFAVGYYHQRYQ